MITRYRPIDITAFDKNTLAALKPYFDINVVTSDSSSKELWFRNLLELAKQSLGMAHCVQHNHTPRMMMETCFDNWPLPISNEYDRSIGCYSNFKSADSMTLDNGVVNGTKCWISNLEQADYGIFRIPVGESEAYILIDFNNMPHSKDMSWMTPMGMELARPGNFTVENLKLPEKYIPGYQAYAGNHPKWFPINNISDYSFITNYLGLIISLHQEFGEYLERKNQKNNFEFERLGLAISSLMMIWEDNLSSLDIQFANDLFWHRRNTQYTMSKDILCQLIFLIIQQSDSRWLDAKSKGSQRMRDALTFCSHMKPLATNLKERHFIKF